MKNKRSSILGVIAICVALLSAAGLVLDGDPKTNPDWAATGIAISTGVNGILQRDQSQHDADKKNGET